MGQKIMVIIPARGGSKGIPNKNITSLGNKPLISYVIETARKSKHVNRVVVSTDDEKIAQTSRYYGAEVPFMRPSEMAQDESPVMPAIHHAVEWFAQNENYKADILLLLQPTSPFIQPQQIDTAIDILLADSTADAVTTVIETPHNFHPYNVREIKSDGSVVFFMPDEHDRYPTRQTKPKFYAFGNFYIFRYKTLTEYNSLYGKRCLPMIIDPMTAFDINYPFDLLVAESILKFSFQEKTSS
jgi:CMP-N,N'-diacetyllegionaminic acid synthase